LEKELKGIKQIKHCQLMGEILVIKCKLDTIMILKHNGNEIYIDEIEGMMDCIIATIHKHYFEYELLNEIKNIE